MEREIIKMYAIIDDESTGGDYDEKELQVQYFQYDDTRITNQFCSLINPKKTDSTIHVKKLTGINSKDASEMLFLKLLKEL